MSETITEVPQAEPKVQSSFDRLSSDPIFGEPKTEPIAQVEPAKVEPVTATIETAALENPTTEVPEVVETPVAEIPAAIEPEVGFEEAQTVTEDGTWKNIIEAVGYQIPEDYTEEKGFEIFSKLKEAEVASKLEEVKAYREAEIFSELPQPVQGEAKLIFELLKTGQTLDEINAPIEQIKAWKSMSKEELIRKNLEGIQGYTPEMIDHKMEQIVAGNHVDIEYQILMNTVNQLEQQVNTQRQQQIQNYNAQQAQVQEQKRQSEFNSFKLALDKVPSFMEKKLSDENKASIITDFSNGYAQTLLRNPEKLAKFMLYDKYGEQGIKYLQSRAIEKATLEKAKEQHNIPPVIQGGGSRIETTTQIKNGIDRLANDPRYA